MAKRKKRNNDIRRRLSDAPYSVDYFARKHDISPEQARELIERLAATATSLMRLPQRSFGSRMQRRQFVIGCGDF